MNKNLKSIIALALSALAVSAYAQEDVTDKYLVNPSFEYSAEGVASVAKDLNSATTYYGWTLPVLGSSWSNKSIGTSSACNGNAMGISAPSEGSCYFFNRQGWGTSTTTLSQKTTLTSGKYYITVDYKAYERNTTNGTLGFSINGTSVKSVKPYTIFTTNTTTYAATDPWKTVGAWFTVESDGEVTIDINESLVGNGARADLYLDNVKLYKWDLNDDVNIVKATSATPLNVTDKYLGNPYFDSGTAGWSFWKESWATAPQNHGNATNKNGAISGKFYENWDANSYKSSIYQVINGVPDGKYRLQIAAFGNNASSTTDKLYVYLNDSKTYVTSATPSFYTVEALCSGGTLDLGIRNEYSASNWMGIDNAELFLLEVKPISIGTPVLSMEKTEDVEITSDVLVDVEFPDYKAITADASSAKVNINLTYQVVTAGEVVYEGTATGTKDAFQIKVPRSILSSRTIYTVEVLTGSDDFSQGYAPAEYDDVNIKFTTTASPFEKAQMQLEEAIREAQEYADNAIVGVNVFQILPSKLPKLQKAIDNAQNQLESLTNRFDVLDAIETLQSAVDACSPTMPKATDRFLIRHKASGFYMSTSEGLKVTPKTDATPLCLHKTEDGGWYIYNTENREYIGYLGTNPWSMANTYEDETDISVEHINVYYILAENGYLGTDDPSTDANVYGNKTKSGNSQWFIEYYEVEPLSNLAFDEGTYINNGICTYAKDCEANGTPYAQMQEVNGWTMGVANGDARAAAQYAWGSSAFLGGKGYTAPAESYTGSTEGGALGMVGVWTGTVQYVQKTELAAGTYTITVPVYNAGGTGEIVKNLIGFIAKDGTEYLATSKTYAVGQWTLEQITFALTQTTEGLISVGYAAANAGSGSMPHLFLDYVDIAEGNPSNSESGADEATAISQASTTAVPVAYYSVDGASLKSAKKGVNIVRMSDNSIKKVIIK